MFRNIIPRDVRFYDLFVDQAVNALDASRLLHELLTDFRDPEGYGLRIRDLEHKGDEISHDISGRLEATFVTPFDREDIHALNSSLDDVVDVIEKTVDTFVLYRIDAPTPAAIQLASIIMQACEAIVETLRRLSTFKDLKDSWVEIHRLESEGDRVSREAIAGLFADSTAAIDVIKWKEVYELLEDCCDTCEDVADIIEKIVVKHA